MKCQLRMQTEGGSGGGKRGGDNEARRGGERVREGGADAERSVRNMNSCLEALNICKFGINSGCELKFML